MPRNPGTCMGQDAMRHVVIFGLGRCCRQELYLQTARHEHTTSIIFGSERHAFACPVPLHRVAGCRKPGAISGLLCEEVWETVPSSVTPA